MSILTRLFTVVVVVVVVVVVFAALTTVSDRYDTQFPA